VGRTLDLLFDVFVMTSPSLQQSRPAGSAIWLAGVCS
jgi:hypothetical protein